MPDQAPTEPYPDEFRKCSFRNPWPTIEVPQYLAPADLARILNVSLFVARQQFRRLPTVKLGRFRRMSYATFQKHFTGKELIHYT
jgi:hypothetical protein